MNTSQDALLPSPEELPADHRSGFVAVIGRPNVGKSTLFNRILAQKIAITSPKPQTTRDQILGIYTSEETQILFLDTPGIHKPQNKLGKYMMMVASETITDADIVLWLVDINTPPKAEDYHIAELLREIHEKRAIHHLIIGLNKLDQLTGGEQILAERIQEYASLVVPITPFPQSPANAETATIDNAQLTIHHSSIAFSALSGAHITDLLTLLRTHLPLGPRYYPADEITDLQMRFIVEELIREKALALYQQEVPHSIAVAVDEFSLREEGITYISATIYVERESQKKIVLGRAGSMIKKLGQTVRPEIEELVGTQVYLELWVKVWEKWRTRENLLRQLGYEVPS